MRALCAVSQEELEAGSSSTAASTSSRSASASGAAGGGATAGGGSGLASPSAGELCGSGLLLLCLMMLWDLLAHSPEMHEGCVCFTEYTCSHSHSCTWYHCTAMLS